MGSTICGADRGVAAHDRPFVVGERAGLAQHRFGDAHLADVVQEEPVGHLGSPRQLRVDPGGKRHTVSLGAIQVSPGGAVLGLHDLGERGHGRDVHLANVFQSGLELAAADSFGLVQAAQLTCEHGELGMDGGQFGVSVRPLPARRMGNASDGHDHLGRESPRHSGLSRPCAPSPGASDSRRAARPRVRIARLASDQAPSACPHPGDTNAARGPGRAPAALSQGQRGVVLVAAHQLGLHGVERVDHGAACFRHGVLFRGEEFRRRSRAAGRPASRGRRCRRRPPAAPPLRRASMSSSSGTPTRTASPRPGP